VFRDVRGLEGRYEECKAAAIPSRTGSGISYHALSDEHMLACQAVLPPGQQKVKRMQVLREAIQKQKGSK